MNHHEGSPGGEVVLTDQPTTAGGEDAAMTPVELLVASLGSCVAFYAGRYLARHGLNRGRAAGHRRVHNGT
jgi:uncharacterized OsmC-like protein